MTNTTKIALLKWWASLSATQKLSTWQAVVIFVMFNAFVGLAVAYNSLRIEKNHEISVVQSKIDQVNENWILYLQESIKNDRELYLKTKMLDEQLEKKQHENTNVSN